MTQAQKTAKAKFKQAIAYRQKTGVSLKEAFAHIYGRKVGSVKKKAAPKKKVGNMKIAKYRVGQKVYSYQNKDYKAPINKLVYSPWNNSGIYDKRDTYKYVLSLKDGNSNFIDEKSISVKSIGAVKKKTAPKKKVAKKVAKKKYGLNPKLDKLYSAKKPGKRKSASGKTYYENRPNRTDINKFSGIGSTALQDLKEIINKENIIQKEIANHQLFIKKTTNIEHKNLTKKQLVNLKKYLKELKIHNKELKKLI